jgi:hypothetical protein
MSEELNSTASVVPEQSPDQAPNAVPEQSIDTVTNQSLGLVPGQLLDTVTNQSLDTVPGQSLDTVPDQSIETASDKSLETVPDKLSETLTDKVSDKAPDRVPSKVHSKESKGSDPSTQRPFRVKLRGSVLALVRLPNKRSVRAAIHQLSTTGGVIHLEKPLDEKLEVEMIFHIHEVTIRGKAQMLFPMWATQGWMQPFRFVGLSDAGRVSLDATLKSFLGEVVKGSAAGA